MPAPIGNKFAIGNSGKPKEFETPEQLDQFIQGYFEKCDNNPIYKLEQKKGNINVKIERGADAEAISDITDEIKDNLVHIPTIRPYTVEGLCLHLNITPQTLINYRKKKGYEEYFDVVKRALLKIREQYITLGLTGIYENRLLQFVLINISPEDYKNKVEETQKGEMKIKWVEEKTYPGKDEAERETNDSD